MSNCYVLSDELLLGVRKLQCCVVLNVCVANCVVNISIHADIDE